jgi:flagellar motor switch protein FliG
MTHSRQESTVPRPLGYTPVDLPPRPGAALEQPPAASTAWPTESNDEEISSLRKAAIVLVSLEQSLASQLLSHLDRSAVEMVTWEIARLERVDPAERAAVLEEFYDLGLRRLCFVFDDLVQLSDPDICTAFHEEDLTTWALALAGAAATVRAKVLGALPAAAARALTQRLDHLGPFRLSEAEAAQVEIAERLRRLSDCGRIRLPEPNGREEVIV